MNVLSLFDGISCGLVALKNKGIKVDNYFASEIDAQAIKISDQNHSEIVRVGDVRNVTGDNLPKIDLLMGGSPCQNLSFAGTGTGLLDIMTLEDYLKIKQSGQALKGQSYLFWEYVRILVELKPKYFLLENVNMDKRWLKVFNDTLKVEAVKINSNLFGPQSRKRYYWTNIPLDELPKTLSYINIIDVCDEDYSWLPCRVYPLNHKSNTGLIGIGACVTTDKQTPWSVATFDDVANWGHIRQPQRLYSALGKSTTLTTSNHTVYQFPDGCRRLTLSELEALQGLPKDYTSCGNKTGRTKAIGNGWHVPTIEFIFNNLDT